MGDQETLWMRCVEVLFRRGRSFGEALEGADSLMVSRRRNTMNALPGLAKCGLERGEGALRARGERPIAPRLLPSAGS